jgi:hypothetical protein
MIEPAPDSLQVYCVSKPWSKQNRREKLTLLLKLVEQGKYKAQIAREIGIGKQSLQRWFNWLERQGLIYREARDCFVLYRLTEHGKLFLTRGERGGGGVWLHGVGWKFPIVRDMRDAGLRDWDGAAEMRNWVKLRSRGRVVTVEKTTRSLLVYVRGLEGDFPYQLYADAFQIAIETARSFEVRYGMVLGVPELFREPHFGIEDPVLKRMLARQPQQVTLDARVWNDETPIPGARESHDALDIAAYQALPRMVLELTGKMDRLLEEQRQSGLNFNTRLEKIEYIMLNLATLPQILEKLVAPMESLKPKPRFFLARKVWNRLRSQIRRRKEN